MNVMHGWLAGAAMLAAGTTSWGGMFVAVKPVLERVDPFTLTLLRYFVSAAAFLLLLLLAEGPRSLRMEGKGLRLWWLGTLGFLGFSILAFLGVRLTRPEHAAVMPATMPLISVIVLAIRQRSWPRSRALLCVALGLLGVALVVTRGNPTALLTGEGAVGALLVFAGAVCWVIYTHGAGALPGWSGLRFTALTCTLSLVSMVPIEALALALGAAHLPLPGELVPLAPSLAYVILVASVLGALFWNAGIRLVGPAQGVLFINLVPVSAFTLAMLGGQPVRGLELLGVALVMLALLLNSLSAPGAARQRPA